MRQIIALLSIGWLLNACAFTDVQVTLPNQGLENAIPGGKNREVVVAVPFSDDRKIRKRCGMQKNGYNMDTADALCQSEPNEWIATLLAKELRKSGFTVLKAGESHGPNAVRIDGSLRKIFVEPVLGMWTGSLEADLSVTLRATTQTGLKAERTFFIKGWKSGQIISSPAAFQLAIQRAGEEILKEMVRAIIALFDRYPQIGMGDAPTLILARHQGENER